MSSRALSATPRRLPGEEGGRLSPLERESVVLLAAARASLVLDNGRLDTQSEKGEEACQRFLEALDATAKALNIDPAPRTYRCLFTEKYRALFAGETRSYRVDMLEVGLNLDQSPIIWANGEQFELSGSVVRCSQQLQVAWAYLSGMLISRASPQACQGVELRAALRSLDEAWAKFENLYVSELMEVQERAKHLVTEAIERERRLRAIEDSHPDQELWELPAYQREVHDFVVCLCRLNAAANVQRKGRDDLSAGTLLGAVDILMQCETEEPLPSSDAAYLLRVNAQLDVGHMLASRVVNSFVALREYLCKVYGHLEQLHPQLSQNAGLVALLVEWEESWEVGGRYMQKQRLFAVCEVVAEIRGAQAIAPALVKMCEDYDPELFLVLPRIILLCFLADPQRPWELVRHLLPHRFIPGDGDGDQLNRCVDGEPLRRCRSAPSLPALDRRCRASSPQVDAELQDLARKFWGTEVRLEHALSAALDNHGEAGAWEILIRRAVCGAGSDEDPYAPLPPSRCGAAKSAVEDLMRDVERFSMELQRHCPQDWNECVGVLSECLKGRRSWVAC